MSILKDENSSDLLLKSILNGTTIKVEPARNNPISVQTIDLSQDFQPGTDLKKSLMSQLNGGEFTIERLAFDSDPTENTNVSGLWKRKQRGLPDDILKRMACQDSLCASIVSRRQNQMMNFGRPQPDRFSTGFKIVIPENIWNKMDVSEREILAARIKKTSIKLETCGEVQHVRENEKMSFQQFLSHAARSALVVGRAAVEFVYQTDPITGERQSSYFRPLDAGTIYKSTKYADQDIQIRQQAIELLERVKGGKFFEIKDYENDNFAWVQVINNQARQMFTNDECKVESFYSVPDIEWDGYPVTPMDTVVSDIITHINITNHNKIYFQHGRAARGMLVLKAEQAGPDVLHRIKQQFNASINSVNNSWRMPVFGIGPEHELTWQPIDNSGRDMEYAYLSDNNARVILSAFQMSPSELAGYQHLERGMGAQSLNESSNKAQFESQQQSGIRALLSQMENFVNKCILPFIDPELSKVATIRFLGLDAETPKQELDRLVAETPVHRTFDEVLLSVDKDPVGKAIGGSVPLNPAYQNILDRYFTVGEVLEFFCGKEGAASDPSLSYRRDPFWVQWQQLQLQQKTLELQTQQQQASADNKELGDVVDTLNKSEYLDKKRKDLLELQKETTNKFMESLKEESKEVLAEIMKTLDR